MTNAEALKAAREAMGIKVNPVFSSESDDRPLQWWVSPDNCPLYSNEQDAEARANELAQPVADLIRKVQRETTKRCVEMLSAFLAEAHELCTTIPPENHRQRNFADGRARGLSTALHHLRAEFGLDEKEESDGTD